MTDPKRILCDKFDESLLAHFDTLKQQDSPAYTPDEVLAVFEYYFQKYEDTFGEVHPSIRTEQIQRIIEAMPYIDGDGDSSAGGDVAAEDYETLIDKHFQTQYRNCDYNINHFFSGDIRLLRFYEELY